MLAGCAGVTLPRSHGLTDCSALCSHTKYMLLDFRSFLWFSWISSKHSASYIFIPEWELLDVCLFLPFPFLALLSKPLLFVHKWYFCRDLNLPWINLCYTSWATCMPSREPTCFLSNFHRKGGEVFESTEASNEVSDHTKYQLWVWAV